MRDGFRIIDADLHVIEPRSMWSEYLDPEYRDRAPGAPPEGSRAWLQVGERPVPAFADHPARVAGLDARYRSPEVLARFAARGPEQLAELATGTTGKGILDAMDVEGVDVAVAFRTQAAHVVAFDDIDPRVAAAYCRAFNRWLRDLCATDPARLLAGAQVPLQDPELAVHEAVFAVEELGARALVLPSHPVCERAAYDRAYDALWAASADLDVAVSFHGIQASYTAGSLATRYVDDAVLGHAVGHPVEAMLTLGAVLTGGVVARHPRLRLAVLEGTCGWLPWWLWVLDERWHGWGDRERTHGLAPSEAFRRQCFVATDVDEQYLGMVVDAIGDENLVVSTDWPHDDSQYPDAIATFLAIPGVTSETKRRILWDNPARLYGVDARRT